MTAFDFTTVNAEETLVEGGTGGGFTITPPEEGVALLRLREILEFGQVEGEYKGKPKMKRPVSLVFELVHPRHAIKKEDGEFIRNHEVTVRLNKSNSDKSKYMQLFNKMNYDGSVSVPKGKVPSFLPFLTKGFLGAIHHNPNKDADKPPYVNLDKGGEYSIGAPKVALNDEAGMPTGEYKDIPVPEMTGAQRVFLWETAVNDEVYKAMWESIAIVGEKEDGTPYKNWIQDSISGEDNVEWEGSRAQALFSAEDQELAAALQPAEDQPVKTGEAKAAPKEPVPEQAQAEALDPLAALGI